MPTTLPFLDAPVVSLAKGNRRILMYSPLEIRLENPLIQLYLLDTTVSIPLHPLTTMPILPLAKRSTVHLAPRMPF